MAIFVGVDRGYATHEEGLIRMERTVSFLEKMGCSHGAYPHRWHGDMGKVESLGQGDSGDDLVEIVLLM